MVLNMSKFKNELTRLIKRIIKENEGLEYSRFGYDYMIRDNKLYTKDLDLDGWEPDIIHTFSIVDFKIMSEEEIFYDIESLCIAIDNKNLEQKQNKGD